MVVRPAAEAEAAVVGPRHRGLETGPADRGHDAADVRRLCPLEGLHAPDGVAGRQLGVGIDPDDDRVPAAGDGQVQPDRDVGVGIVHEPDARIVRGQPLDELGRAVGRRPQREHDLRRPGIVLVEDARDR